MDNDHTFTTARYIREMEKSYFEGGASYIKSQGRFPWLELIVYTSMVIVMVALGNRFEIVQTVVPFAVFIAVVHVGSAMYKGWKFNRKFGKIAKSFRKVKKLLESAEKISLHIERLSIVATLRDKTGKQNKINLPSDEITYIDLGMNRYLEVRTINHRLIIPASLFSMAEFQRIIKPFQEVIQMINNPSKTKTDALEKLREQIPMLVHLHHI